MEEIKKQLVEAIKKFEDVNIEEAEKYKRYSGNSLPCYEMVGIVKTNEGTYMIGKEV